MISIGLPKFCWRGSRSEGVCRERYQSEPSPHERIDMRGDSMVRISLRSCGLRFLFYFEEQQVFRKRYPRIYELKDFVPSPHPPGAYFRDLDAFLPHANCSEAKTV
jgi:hypothetical protein